MGRPSKLSEKQWVEVEKRLLDNEPIRALAREYKISEAAIRQRVSTQVKDVKAVANQIVETERALSQLPIKSQIYAHSLASKLRATSDHLASAAMHGAATSHRLNAIANSEVAKIDDADPLSSIESIKSIGILTKLANDSSTIALNLLNANKASIEKFNDAEERAESEGKSMSAQDAYSRMING